MTDAVLVLYSEKKTASTLIPITLAIPMVVVMANLNGAPIHIHDAGGMIVERRWR